MDTDEFENHIRELLFNPTDAQGNSPFPHTQEAATMKIPQRHQAYLLKYPDGQIPLGPHSYTVRRPIGNSAAPRVVHDDYFTQMRFGPRAVPAMMDVHDRPDDVGNPRPGTGKPGAGLPGQRFTIRNVMP